MYINSFVSSLIIFIILFLVISLSIQLLPYFIIAYIIYRAYRYLKHRFYKEPRNDGGVDIEDDVVFYDETHKTEQMKQATVIDIE